MRSTVRSMTAAALMAALMCLLSPVGIPVGAANMTLQTLLTALAGYMLRPRAAMMAVAAYLMIGACGLPVFSGFAGGMGVLLGPTGGFLMGFPWMALLCAVSAGKGRAARIGAGMAGLAVVYILGAAGLAVSAGMTFWQAAAVGAAPFVWKDVLSVIGAEWMARRMHSRIGGF